MVFQHYRRYSIRKEKNDRERRKYGKYRKHENVRNVAAKEGVCSLENAVNTENSTEMAGMEYAENTDSSENAQNKEGTEAVPSQDRQLINRLIDRMTLLFDDDLMSRVFDKNIAATELLLRIILGRKLKVISADGQREAL